MKHLLLLLCPFLAISFPCIAEDYGTQLVYDTENHEVTGGESYYVLPAEHGSGGGGGLRMFPTRRHYHNLVYQAHNETNVGIPIRFNPPNDHLFSGNIFLSTNVTISFDTHTICLQPMYWNVGYLSFSSPSQPSDRVAVGKEASASYPVPLSREFVFRIERYNTTAKAYKLVSCAGQGPCKDLGLYAYQQKTWLAVSDVPFVVVFKKYINA